MALRDATHKAAVQPEWQTFKGKTGKLYRSEENGQAYFLSPSPLSPLLTGHEGWN